LKSTPLEPLALQARVVQYNGGIAVHSSLLNAVLHDQPQIKI
jgi:hypothetical protein